MYNKIKTFLSTKVSPIASVTVLLMASFATPLAVHAQTASQLQSQADDLQTKIEQNQATADDLSGKVQTLKDKIAEIDADIATTQAKIAETDKRIAELKDQLIKAQADLDRQKDILKANLKQLYKTTGATSVELLFSSEDFSGFINKQEYLDQLKNGVKNSLENVMALKKDLETKKAEQEQLQTAQELRKKDLEASKAERADTLTKTQGDETKYRAMVEDLKNQQLEINRKIAEMATSISYAGTGSYPWASVAGDSWYWLGDYGSDPWGMGYRQCVSYTAWKVASTGRNMPTTWINGRGNAAHWVSSAQEDGIPVDQTARRGDVAILLIGYYGHAMYVEDVYDNGTMRVSQYNYNYDGNYSAMTMPSYRSDMYFIHFP